MTGSGSVRGRSPRSPAWSPWLVGAAILAPILAHAPWLGAAWRGELILGAPLDDGDAIYAHRLADDALARLGAAWDASGNPVTFLLVDLWRAPVAARAYQVLDFLLLLWPARALLPTAPAFMVVHLALLALAALGGALAARALGAGAMGQAAGALAASASGIAVATTSLGQYPQAMIGAGLLAFAGLERLRVGARGGVALAGGGSAAALLLYWANAPILLVGVAAWAFGAWLAELPVAPGLPRRAALAIGLAALLVAPGAWQVWTATATGDYKLHVVPWATPLFDPAVVREGLSAVTAEVRASALLSPSGGWLVPTLPMLPLLALALTERRAWPWVAMAAAGAVLVLGPLPAWPEALGGRAWPALSETILATPLWMDPTALDTEPRARNWAYLLIFQWVPLASRMRHPLRWGLLLAAATVALVALGADRLARRNPALAGGLVLGGIAWAALIGPWPLPRSPYPGDLARALASCSEVLLPGLAPGAATDLAARLDALHGRPRYPVRPDPAGGLGDPDDATRARSDDRESALHAAFAGDRSRLAPGACVVFEGDAAPEPARLAFGEFDPLDAPAHALTPTARRFWLWRAPG